jgi:hypothetical protein
MFAGIFDHPSAWNPLRALLFPVLSPGHVSAAIVAAVIAGRTALVPVPRHMGPFVSLARAAFPLPLYDAFVGCVRWQGIGVCGEVVGRLRAAGSVKPNPLPYARIPLLARIHAGGWAAGTA